MTRATSMCSGIAATTQGRVDIMRLEGDALKTGEFVPGTDTNIRMDGLLSFSPVSIRGNDVFRVQARERPRTHPSPHGHEGVPGAEPEGSHRSTGAHEESRHLRRPRWHAEPRAARWRESRRTADRLRCADQRTGRGGRWTYLCAGRGRISLRVRLQEAKRRCQRWIPASRRSAARSPANSPMRNTTGSRTTATSPARTRTIRASLPPLRMRWARRLEGTVKHLPVCGGGRLYTHTAEGQIIAVRAGYRPAAVATLLAGRVFVLHLAALHRRQAAGAAGRDQEIASCAVSMPPPASCFGKRPSPVRQAGAGSSRPWCMARWRSTPRASGEYAAQGTEKPFTFGGTPVPAKDGREVMSWIYSNDNPYYPKDHHPRLWAWDLDTGKVVWEKDFFDQGRGGNDCGICILDGKLYYSVFFGYDAEQRARRGLPVENNGLTACIEPADRQHPLADERVLRHRQMHAQRPRRPPLHRRQQPGATGHRRSLRLVPRCERRQALVEIRRRDFRAECRQRRRAFHLLQRPARQRQRLRPRNRQGHLQHPHQLRLLPLHAVRTLSSSAPTWT